MLPAEVTRILLLVGLAATGYLMILAWNEDYLQAGRAADYAPAPLPQESGYLIVPKGAPPSDTANAVRGPDSSAASDVPDAALIAGTDLQPAAPVARDPVSGQRLVHVLTPRLEVWIDRLGGDVVRVQLPGFPVAIDRPDVPFLLLDNSGGHTYVAQSGLFGEDGVDTGDGRPLY